MFDSITGTVVRKDPQGLVLSVQGIGYQLAVPLRSLRALPEEGEITLYTHLAVKDDSLRLYGFQTPFERDLFLKIQGVSGIGPSTAMAFLSEIPPRKLGEAVALENLSLLQSIKGVGVRTAKRLVLELKDKIAWEGLAPEDGAAPPAKEATAGGNLATDLVAALQALGYPRNAARDAASRALAARPDTEDLEELIKTALRSM
jgi:Holliday junction DNA helicase RuvA